MVSVVVDVDDTAIDTERRTQGVWHQVLDRKIPLQVVQTLSSQQIFEKYASSERQTNEASRYVDTKL